MLTDTRTIVLVQRVPIPVGHRVEITAYRSGPGARGLFGSGGGGSAPNQAVVRDLDDGVVYGCDWHFGGVQALSAIGRFTAEPSDDLVVVERLRGRVVACQVIERTPPGMVQTHLTLEPLPEPDGTYR